MKTNKIPVFLQLIYEFIKMKLTYRYVNEVLVSKTKFGYQLKGLNFSGNICIIVNIKRNEHK